MAFTDLLCSLVNWKLLRDTALNHCLKRLLTYPTSRQLSALHVEAAALILQAVEPWMQLNWGYASYRYLDAYLFRIQSWCDCQMLLSTVSEGHLENATLCHNCMVSPYNAVCLFVVANCNSFYNGLCLVSVLPKATFLCVHSSKAHSWYFLLACMSAVRLQAVKCSTPPLLIACPFVLQTYPGLSYLEHNPLYYRCRRLWSSPGCSGWGSSGG